MGVVTATTLAPVLHEIATNFLTFGALSAAIGTLDVSATPPEDGAIMVQAEHGSPPVAALTRAGGFGCKPSSEALRRSAARSTALGGKGHHDVDQDGALCDLRRQGRSKQTGGTALFLALGQRISWPVGLDHSWRGEMAGGYRSRRPDADQQR